MVYVYALFITVISQNLRDLKAVYGLSITHTIVSPVFDKGLKRTINEHDVASDVHLICC